MDVEWLAQDPETLAHTARLKISGKSTVAPQAAEVSSPHHATVAADEDGKTRQFASTIVIAGEALSKQTLDNIGYSKGATDALIYRLKTKMIPNRINLVYPRIPSGFEAGKGNRVPMPPIDEIQTAALVDVQLEAGAALILPPIGATIDSFKRFDAALKRTLVSIQTFNEKKEIVGYIPTTDNLELVSDMVNAYVKAGVHFFAVDFSGASNSPALMRTVVRRIRERMGIKKRAGERDEKYYLHVFNVATSKKSSMDSTPLSDIITHPYGVDSTSGVMWGGGTLDITLLRYYNTLDYGAYRPKLMAKKPKACECPVCKDTSLVQIYNANPNTVFRRLKRHRLYAYAEECSRISAKISGSNTAESYWPYLLTKEASKPEVQKIIRDVREVRAML